MTATEAPIAGWLILPASIAGVVALRTVGRSRRRRGDGP